MISIISLNILKYTFFLKLNYLDSKSRQKFTNFSDLPFVSFMLVLSFLLIFVSFDFDNLKSANGQPQYPQQQQQYASSSLPVQQWPQFSSKYFAVQYPPEWKVKDTQTNNGISMFTSDGFEFTFIYYPPGNKVFNPSVSATLTEVSQLSIQYFSQYGMKYVSSYILQNNGILNIYKDNNGFYLKQQLYKTGNDPNVYSYNLVGTWNQIERNFPLANQVVKTIQWYPVTANKLNENNQIDRYNQYIKNAQDFINKLKYQNNQIMQDTLNLGVEGMKHTSQSIHESTEAYSDYLEKKQCQKDPRNIAC